MPLELTSKVGALPAATLVSVPAMPGEAALGIKAPLASEKLSQVLSGYDAYVCISQVECSYRQGPSGVTHRQDHIVCSVCSAIGSEHKRHASRVVVRAGEAVGGDTEVVRRIERTSAESRAPRCATGHKASWESKGGRAQRQREDRVREHFVDVTRVNCE